MYEREWPEDGELVVCTVADVKDFAAFVTLDEYNERRGLIPISEIARGWIKHIRDYVREGQKVVCKVLNVDPDRGHIDLSLKDVNEHQRREKIHEWKNEQKAAKWVGFASEASGADREIIEEAIHREYSQLYPAFEDIVTTGGEAADKLKLDEPVKEALINIANENVKVSRVTITGHLVLTSARPDGVNVIRRALRSAQPKVENVDIDLIYVGAPKYRIKVTAPDYKEAEKAIEKAASAAVGVVERAGGSGKFIRKQKAG
ncbi:translation initiation factor IF-2 subunit alpha [Methanoculleus sp. YWC-01]|jgi:translation initiation factor 2 subunit 1|uniref:Translation initiation factor IF-2 subunit alpha n=1 Tax=Methanoculleus nereidis TaxID=2735141 RepID=A0ABU3Z1U1_9EURY|nr:translation initiation factor IF-2 subunit alpha [Methanoculleus sp. YWC-01]MCK9297996.1 translation initiation factor IF-2 subunit alpha [Methanoculleus sp.]MDV4342784.1 translation initiation factor IF-2 subunit alpha [Methanoculleus sp. YWC-01]PKL55321.1 MAG: translation initiation factor IF-2 subunit alpha [Methanomicrobiales archaeon HGW-Methanomicrobiales-6]